MTKEIQVSLDGITALPPGHVATIKTYLKRSIATDGPALIVPSASAPEGYALHRITGVEEALYRHIFVTLGQRWLWWSRAMLSRGELGEILDHPEVMAFAVTCSGIEIGLLELDFRLFGAEELAFLGLFDGHTGRGIGNWLMTQALRMAQENGAASLLVHTCTFDHPGALGFYRKWGFAPFRQAVEIVPDPRLRGYLPRDAAAHIPVIAG